MIDRRFNIAGWVPFLSAVLTLPLIVVTVV